MIYNIMNNMSYGKVKKTQTFCSEEISGIHQRRLHRIGAWVALIFGAIGIALSLFIVNHIWEHRLLKFPSNLGNARAADLIEPDDSLSGPVRFAVIGDINNGTETFEDVIARLRGEKQVAFLILLGDCAASPMLDLHTYFINEFAETGLNLPTFIVAGNHDVAEGRFGYPEFEKLYGPANFTFMYRENLFIGLGGIHDGKKLADTLPFLEKTLQEKRSLAKRVFVFMHYPSAPADYVPADWREQAKKFQNVFEQYSVTYVLSGHYHRLARTVVNGVVYLTTGGGGGKFQDDRFGDIGLFHHVTIIETGVNSIAENIIPVAPASWLSKSLERVERTGLISLLPWVQQHPVMGIVMAIVITGLFLWGAIDRWRYLVLLRSHKKHDFLN
jgi:predicted phosphodiesterase